MTFLLIAVVVFVAIFFVGALAMARALRKRNEAAVVALGDALAGRQPLLRAPANLFGRKSKGAFQVRGNGHLAITDDALVFSQIVGAEVFEVERSSITKIDTTATYLGKSVGRELLVVTWADDEAAWYVRDLSGWLEALRRP